VSVTVHPAGTPSGVGKQSQLEYGTATALARNDPGEWPGIQPAQFHLSGAPAAGGALPDLFHMMTREAVEGCVIFRLTFAAK
jgi:hypothetical protein